MLTEKSKTLREFYLSAKTKSGETLDISFGYDVSGIHSGFFVSASVNGALENSTKSTLAKVESLKIPALTSLIAAIGTDVTGAYPDYEKRLRESLAASYVCVDITKGSAYKALKTLCRATSDRDSLQLDAFLNQFKTYLRIDEPRKANASIKAYIKSNRLRLLDMTKKVVTDIRRLVMDGVLVNGEAVAVNFSKIPVSRGTKDVFNTAYYKRDIDSIRKARMKIYKSMGRKYVPPTYED